ncbi:polysaccharide deacetylase family protein [Jatrophihabitans endophyticus]|nr:polysaccharide deacetylase family protein [Jatrophihabitans endophyticus]
MSAHRDALAAGRFLRVVNFHNTPRGQRDVLYDELARYAKRFAAVTLAELDGFFATGRWTSDRPGFVPVFYEGYRTCHDVAAAVCDELGLAAWFAVCTGFVDTPPAEQEVYARSHDIGLTAEELAMRGERIALSWDEVAELSRRHVVLPHTASHAGIGDVGTDDDLEREVFEPKRRMDAATGQSAPAFVWLHGTQWGMSERHDRALQQAGYRYQISNTMIHRIA